MDRYDGPLFDCDNHYYEAHDAFMRHVPRSMQKRCVQWVEMDGKRRHLVAGKLNHAVGNPTFNPISKPGVLRKYYRGNPENKTFYELIRSQLEPMPPEYMDRDARVIVMRPSPILTRDGWRPHTHERFDPFWARVNEAGITVVAHVGSTAYTANGYGGNSAIDALGGGLKPSVAGLIPERAINDFLLTFAYDKTFERFPNLRIASVENGSGFLGDLFVKLEQSKQRMRWYYKEDPSALFRRSVWINPFWEDRIPDVIEHMGADRVLYGSDWPHMEGMEQPRDILDELEGVSLADQQKFLHGNGASLNECRPL
jgi:predicted TIM-barrel fold metal-dependent hydrolase